MCKITKPLFQFIGKIQLEFLLCEHRGRCATCTTHRYHPELCKEKLREVMLLDDVYYVLPSGDTLYLKAGFVYDGASIPRFFWRFIGFPLDPQYIRAATLHDGLYGSQALLDRYTKGPMWWRKYRAQWTSDSWFLEFMKEQDVVPWWKRNIIWLGVRLGGWTVWLTRKQAYVNKCRQTVSLIKADDAEQWYKATIRK